MDKFIGKDNKNRKLYEGRKGGIYYYTESGRKSYVNKAAMKRKSITKAKRRTDDGDDEKNMDKLIGEDDKHRKLYQGGQGGIYYYTASGRKSYVNKFDIKFAKSATKAKRRTAYNNYEEFKKEKPRTVSPIEIAEWKKYRSEWFDLKLRKTTDDDDDDEKHRGKFIDKDDKHRKLYRGGKGGIYYYTESGKKSYVNKFDRKFAKSATKAKRRTAYNNYEEFKKRKPRTVSPIEIAEWKEYRSEWFDGAKVGAKSVVIRGGTIPQGTTTNINDTTKANKKRWPIAIKGKLKDSKKTLKKIVVPNPLPWRIQNKGDAGHLVARTLGGDTDDSNIIPQNPTINRQLGYPWRDFEEEVKEIIAGNKTEKKYTYIVTPIYGNVEELDAL